MRHFLAVLVLMLVLSAPVSAQETSLSPYFDDRVLPNINERVTVLKTWMADINDDGKEELMVVTSGGDNSYNTANKNQINVYGENGTKIWKYGVDDRIRSIIIYDINNDRMLETIVASGQTLNKIQRGTIRILGADGKLDRSYDSTAIMFDIGLGDIEGDRYYDIAGGSEKRVFLFRAFGERIWMYPPHQAVLLNESVTAVVLDDVDKDGKQEVVAASDYIYYLDGVDGTEIYKLDLEPDLPLKKKGYKFLKTANLGGIYRDTIAVTSADRIVAVRIKEVKTDTLGRKYTFENEWEAKLGCGVKDILLSMANDKYDNILVACSDNKIYMINRNGGIAWSYLLDGEPTSIYLEDVDSDGNDDILASVSSGSIYALDLSGYFMWRYSTAAPLLKVAAGDMAGDGNKVIVAVSGEPKVMAYRINESYTERRKANTLFYLGRDEFLASKNIIQSLGHLKEAKAIFDRLGDEQMAQTAQTYITKIENLLSKNHEKEADILYARADEYYQTGDYENALTFLDKATRLYQEYNNNDGLVKCELMRMQIELIRKTPPTATLPPTTSTTIPEEAADNTQALVILGAFVLAAAAIVALKVRSARANQAAEDDGFGGSKDMWEKERTEEDGKINGGDKT
ncbi:MAG: tetratricopeptide repeat protein [Candidatus Altiarchaeota archaeon]